MRPFGPGVVASAAAGSARIATSATRTRRAWRAGTGSPLAATWQHARPRLLALVVVRGHRTAHPSIWGRVLDLAVQQHELEVPAGGVAADVGCLDVEPVAAVPVPARVPGASEPEAVAAAGR